MEVLLWLQTILITLHYINFHNLLLLAKIVFKEGLHIPKFIAKK